MARKRSREFYYVCASCGVAISSDGVRHYPGSAGRSRCKRPKPMLIADYEAMEEQLAAEVRAALEARRR